jgi:hypothetical protein
MQYTRKKRGLKNKSKGLKKKSRGSKKGTPKVNKRKLRGGLVGAIQRMNPFEKRQSLEENKKIADLVIKRVNDAYPAFSQDIVESQMKIVDLIKLLKEYVLLAESSLQCPDDDCRGIKSKMYEDLYDSGVKLLKMLDYTYFFSPKNTTYVENRPTLEAKVRVFESASGRKPKVTVFESASRRTPPGIDPDDRISLFSGSPYAEDKKGRDSYTYNTENDKPDYATSDPIQ